jgi:tetratricopeptide (TPR) repeat protein
MAVCFLIGGGFCATTGNAQTPQSPASSAPTGAKKPSTPDTKQRVKGDGKLPQTIDISEAKIQPVAGVKKTHQQADAALRSGDMKGAAKAFSSAVLASPKEPMLRLSAGILLAEVGLPADATRQFREAVRYAEDDVIAALLLQSALTEQGAGAEAQEIYQDTYRRFAKPGKNGLNVTTSIARLKGAIQQYGESPVYYLLLGDAHQLAEEWAEADRCYLRAERLAPRWVKPLVNRGISQLAQGKLDGAITIFEQALKVEPRNKQAQVLRITGEGQRYANARSFGRAIDTLNYAQKLAPKDPTPSVMIAQIQTDNGNFQAAADAYETALGITRSGGLFAQRPVLYRSMAEAWLSAKQPERAIETLHRALTDEPNSSPLWYRLIAEAQFDMGEVESGRGNLRAALDSESGAYPLDTLRAIDAKNQLLALKQEYQALEKGFIQETQPSGTVKITMANPNSRTSDNQVRALVALAHIARYEGNFREEVRLRQELSKRRSSAWDWYLMGETFDLRLSEPTHARDAYLKCLEIANRQNDLNEATRKFARERLSALTAPIFKPK